MRASAPKTGRVSGWLLGALVSTAVMASWPSHAGAFEEVGNEDVLEKGPSMGPIDSERPAPKYLRKDTYEEVTGLSDATKSLENFDQPDLDMRPVFVEALPRWGIELRFGPYRPRFSSRPQGQALYNLVMVQDNHDGIFNARPIMLSLEADYYILRRVGLLGAYGRVGYWTVHAPSRACVANDGVTFVPCNSTTVFQSVAGNDEAGLTAMPLSLGALWRYDGLKRHTPVPLLFTAKLGLDGHFWWGSSGGKRSRYEGRLAKGITLGWQASVGMSLNVDGFAKRALSRIRSRVENNLFIELAAVRGRALVDSSRRDRVDFTDNRMVTVGLACDFK